MDERLTDKKLANELLNLANRMGCDVNGFDYEEDAYNKMLLFLFKQFEASLKEKQQLK